MRELEHLKVELSGTNLIEASAGTGKTYAIACLYLRLLIEKELTPEQILVVSFTEAATEELRGRIRNRIGEALEVFAGGETEDPFLQGLRENSNGRGPGSPVAVQLLDRAIRSFDTASIFTIHGFCLRALQDNAFESGSLYDTELVTDPTGLFRETVDDFWRRHFFDEEAPLLKSALRNGHSPDSMAAFAQKMLENPKMKILPEFAASDQVAFHGECLDALAAVKKGWEDAREEVVNIITTDKGLSRSASAYRADLLPDLFEAMDSFMEVENPCDLFEGFDKFCTSGILKGKKEKGAAPEHPFFVICENLKRKVSQRFLLLKWELVEFCREQLPLRKRAANIRFFSDLLSDLYFALNGEAGDSLAASLRGKYRAALIDEFQDTDPVQYDIFRQIYQGPEATLFLIGDPKQAIYSFRGADIFAYMEAANDVKEERRFTLTSNWRSTPTLLTAFNTVFDNGRRPFLYGDIAYHPISAGSRKEGKEPAMEGCDGAPLQVWTFPADDEGEPITVTRANEIIPGRVAAEIARLLGDETEGKILVEGKPVAPGDIAVIVRSHRQAALVQDSLRELGIPSVMRSDESIFCTTDAREVCTILSAIVNHGQESRVRAALSTSILGLNGNEIAALLDDEKGWEEWLEKFREYSHIWLERGFMVMSQAFLCRERVRGRLLSKPDGERRLTNLLHCFELIHQAAQGGELGMESRLAWFADRVAAGEESEEYQIRLETDEKAVKIVTVHVSKGLEYPIVFCPFMWGGVRQGDEVVTFHQGFGMVKDFGSDELEAHRLLAEKEALAESLRLLYVALTRAKYRCCLVAGKVAAKKGARPESSPLSYLFHAPEEIRGENDLVPRLIREVGRLSAADMEKALREMAVGAEGAISVVPMPEAVGGEGYIASWDDGRPLVGRKLRAVIDREWRVASFTSFARRGGEAVELPDRDESTAEPDLAGEGSAGLNIFTFPKGVQAGIFLHEVFERIEFHDPSRNKIEELVAAGLARYGFPADWRDTVCGTIENVLAVRIPSQNGAFSLSGLCKGSWVTELEFFFPLRFITSDLLGKAMEKWNSGAASVDLLQVCSQLGFGQVRGMVRGFMDMVFEQGGKYYLLDWKSNHLGNGRGDYSTEKLKRAMEKNMYPLQYLLYTVALNKYLSLRVGGYDYETHFGGVIYVFLRGVSVGSEGETGIFMDVPPAGLIRELTALLVDGGEG